MAKINKKTGAEGHSQTSGGGQVVHDDGSSLELSELFCSLGSLIVEGRLPEGDGGASSGGRGYYEGPHVELPGKISRHKCSQNEYLCNKNENFRKHMLLLWQNNVPMSIEILLCSDCRVGEAKARSLEVTTVPEPGSILLEQWTVAVTTGGHGQGGTMSGLALLQAVRSYLHFSQLSAWYSKTGGTKPWNILIRITIPGEAFSSKFSRPPEHHYFPAAGAGGSTNINVSVKSLPRSDNIPAVVCAHNQSTSSPEEEEESKLGMAGALAWRDQADLRRTIAKSKLVSSETFPAFQDCPGSGRLTKSDSMDSMLGDSLIDPPQSLSKIPPKRYQSPSRCGSPSLEAPEPLMQYRCPPPAYDQATNGDTESPDSRLNRHDLLRRRDLTQFHGLHPRLFHGPRLSLLPPKLAPAGPKRPMNLIPCRAMVHQDQQHQEKEATTPSVGELHQHVVNDRMPVRCTMSGKHICQFEEEVEEQRPADDNIRSLTPPQQQHEQSPSGDHYKQEELGAKAKGWTSRVGRTSTPYSRDSSSDSSQADPKLVKLGKSSKVESQHLDNFMPADEVDDVLNYLKSRNSPTSISRDKSEQKSWFMTEPSRRPSFDDPIEKSGFKPEPPHSLVYRSEISPNNNNFLSNHKLDKLSWSDKSSAYNIHSLLETRNSCHYGDSSNDASPLSPTIDLPGSEPSTSCAGNETNNNKIDSFGCDLSRAWNLDPGACAEVNWSPTSDINLGDLCQDMTNKCLISKNASENGWSREAAMRIRSFSETGGAMPGIKTETNKVGPILYPLDYSYGELEDSWSVLEESLESLDNVASCGDKRRKSIEDDESVPSANKKNAFRKSFDSAASMVFQRRTGLPLTSSPAPMRRGIKFDFDSGINTPKDIKRALFEAQSPEESECGSPKKKKRDPRRLLSTSAPATISSNNLLCNFEESVLNGRLEPVSTVEGFTAEIGASGSFQPKHLSFPVTVFFYTLCENSNYASPYLGHINLGKKGYKIPDKGTIQLTLFNPLGTVVKMFVVMYDLTDMPPNSQTFLRQRTLYMPANQSDNHPDAQKWLRYLIHLRVASSKSGKIYLHTDVRMIIFRKSDLDTATDHESGKGWELRSFTRGPSNPKFSPRK